MINGIGILSGHDLTIDNDGSYIDRISGENKNEVVKKYSLMKFGSVKEIEEAAEEIYRKFIDNFDKYEQFFEDVKRLNQFIVIAAPGYRNVESASNSIIDKAIKKINIVLSLKDLPTIIVIKLPRLESNKANYATLSAVERSSLPPTTDQIMPGREFFQFPIHFIFGDDVKITGATAKGAQTATEKFGGLSFSEIYWVSLDPELTAKYPGVEDKINQFQVKNTLDENIEYILGQDNFQPVQRLIRLVLNEKNREALPEFVKNKVSDSTLKKLFVSAHNNDYPKNELYSESVKILNQEMFRRNLTSPDGSLN